MAKKRRRRRPSLITKTINVGILALAFSPAINLVLGGGNVGKALASAYSAGMTDGSFNRDLAMQTYGPIVAAIILKKAISMVRRTARV